MTNGHHYIELQSSFQAMMGCQTAFGPDFVLIQPRGKYGSAFNKEELLKRMNKGQVYGSEVNMMWFNFFWTAQQGVPINKTQLEEYRNDYDLEHRRYEGKRSRSLKDSCG